jgi:hypothetical protein
VGCVTSAAAGGSCGAGAASAGFAEAAGAFLPLPRDRYGGTIARGIIGGIASALGGGKFANGAVTAAFGYLYNHLQHSPEEISPRLANRSKLNGFAFTQDPGMWIAAEKDSGLEGFFNMYAHSDGSHIKLGGQYLGVEQTYQLLVDHGWSGQPIVLWACNTGREFSLGGQTFAQRLADLTGVDVVAPNGFYFFSNKINPFANEGRMGTFRPSVYPAHGGKQSDTQNGSMIRFRPSGG